MNTVFPNSCHIQEVDIENTSITSVTSIHGITSMQHEITLIEYFYWNMSNTLLPEQHDKDLSVTYKHSHIIWQLQYYSLT